MKIIFFGCYGVNMKLVLLAFFVLGYTWNLLAGPISSGGGDPKVAEFLNIADEVCHWSLRQNLETAYSPITVCKRVIGDLKGSLNHSVSPKIAFTDRKLYDGGVSKVAIFDRKRGRILVNRYLWKELTVIEKYVVVSIELSGLCGVEKRYDFGQKIAMKFPELFDANSLTCKISAFDPKNDVLIELLPLTTKPIDLIYDYEFHATLIDSNNKSWRVNLLESAPSESDSEISLSWAIRDANGSRNEIENVSVGMPFVNDARSSISVLFNGLVLKASCRLHSAEK